ncbi:predicted protein [Naegleria gruberi]|uniref:Predicted protein n=1 Tax=Naegleria gruberi TaxID=5762 RepID=D2VHN2_NAEGR|nr:uncharacterized protein NAEGRDRAFT_68385 [Naegleria gruberi]EFC43709.1 predicted protein [Naegleria gruberi]|eukprot:XP_002676453.1 predicted protein [Naegleria gruberi strain NEG-M]
MKFCSGNLYLLAKTARMEASWVLTAINKEGGRSTVYEIGNSVSSMQCSRNNLFITTLDNQVKKLDLNNEEIQLKKELNWVSSNKRLKVIKSKDKIFIHSLNWETMEILSESQGKTNTSIDTPTTIVVIVVTTVGFGLVVSGCCYIFIIGALAYYYFKVQAGEPNLTSVHFSHAIQKPKKTVVAPYF